MRRVLPLCCSAEPCESQALPAAAGAISTLALFPTVTFMKLPLLQAHCWLCLCGPNTVLLFPAGAGNDPFAG